MAIASLDFNPQFSAWQEIRPKSAKPEDGNFGIRQLYLAHSALSDLHEKNLPS